MYKKPRKTKPKLSEPIIIATGVSGAGKSQALKILEDFGYFCVDNLPLPIAPKFLDILEEPFQDVLAFGRIALGIDIRAKGFVDDLPKILEEFKMRGYSYKTLYLDAAEEALLRRFSETRHRHPLTGKALLDAIRTEKGQLMKIKEMADKVIDTSQLTLGELKEQISSFLGVVRAREMSLAVVSFGYKYGLPIDADLIWDVRFLPNPNYIAALKPLTGLEEPVSRYVLKQAPSEKFLNRLTTLLKELIPLYMREGKSYLTIGIGCTGGRHRSVAITRALATKLRRSDLNVREFHRDIDKK